MVLAALSPGNRICIHATRDTLLALINPDEKREKTSVRPGCLPALASGRPSSDRVVPRSSPLPPVNGSPLDTVRVRALIREPRLVTAFASHDEALFEQKPGRPSHLRWSVDTSKLALSRSGIHLAESQRKHSGQSVARWAHGGDAMEPTVGCISGFGGPRWTARGGGVRYCGGQTERSVSQPVLSQ